MSDYLKYIVTQLNKPPFNKNYNLISFDSISPEDLLQMLTDILATIDPSNKIDVRTEEPEQTTVRLLTMLRVLKYKPGSDINVSFFRQGLVQGDKSVIHPILEWLLKNIEDLKKRAYLAKFLVKVEVPPEILGDIDIGTMYEQYEKLIEEFKAAHKECETIKSSGNSTAELKSDIEAMEKEQNIVTKRIDRMIHKVENVPGKEVLLEACHELRIEKERQKDLTNQKQDEVVALQQLQQRYTRLNQQLRELRQSSLGATPQGLLQRLEEETNMTSYIVSQKLPRELEQRKKEVNILTNVAMEPSVNRNTLDFLEAKIQEVSAEVNEMVEQHLATSNPVDDKLAPFRQQAAIIARKKDTIAEQFSELKAQLNKLEEEIEEKQEQIKEAGGEGGVLRGDEFKRYVSKLRARSSLYKRHRAELAQLKAEGGVLARTLDILKARFTELDSNICLPTIQASRELHTSTCTQEITEHTNGDSRSQETDIEGRTFDEVDALVTQLQNKIVAQKAALAPLINELRPLREKVQEVTTDYDEKKKVYDRTAAALDSGAAKLEQEVRNLYEERNNAESQAFITSAKAVIVQVQLQRVNEEMRHYVEKGNTPTLRDKLCQKIAEQERLNRQLKEDQQSVRNTQEKRARQRQLWLDLKTLLECKKACMEEAKKNAGVLHLEKGAETLVLQ